jgi:glucosamine--fructose-6-phosphate aminotransferase (isomerizing)
VVLRDLVACNLAEKLAPWNPRSTNIVSQVQTLPDLMQQFLDHTEDIPYYASRYFNHNSIFFIGRNLDYAMGLEGSLKLKEISYIHSEAYASGELKHGTISLIEEGTLVVALGTYAPLFDKAMSNVVEVKARGAEVCADHEAFRSKMERTPTPSSPAGGAIRSCALSGCGAAAAVSYYGRCKEVRHRQTGTLAKSVTVE